MIRRAHPALREVNETLEILDRQNETIRDFIEDADTVSAAVEPKKENLSRWAQEAMETAEIQASRADRLQAQWNKLPRFLGELRPTLAQLDATASEQIPFLRRMRAAAPDFHRLLVALESFSNASRVSTRALGEAAVVGRKALIGVGGGDRRASRAVRGRTPPREAASPVPADDRQPQAVSRQRADPRGPRSPGPRQDRRAGRRGLHRHGGPGELHLLAVPGDQRLRPGQPLPADRPLPERLLGLPEQPDRDPDQAVFHRRRARTSRASSRARRRCPARPRAPRG